MAEGETFLTYIPKVFEAMLSMATKLVQWLGSTEVTSVFLAIAVVYVVIRIVKSFVRM